MIRPFLLAVGVTFCFGLPTLHAQDKFLGKTSEGWVSQLLKAADPKLRRDAGFALGKLGFRAATSVTAMKNAYAGEKDVKVREAIVFALAEISRESPPVREDAELEKLFLGAITDADPYLRRSAAFGLGCLVTKSDATLKALDNVLDDKEAIVRQNAAWAIGQFGEKALPSLRKALVDSDSLVKRDAAGALMQVADPDKVREVLKELLPLCRDNNSEVRRAALNVLVRIVDHTDRVAIPALKWALEDRDVENKRNAALALSNIGGEETVIAVPVLLEAAKNGDEELRRQAVIALRNIGPSAKAALPALVGFLNADKDAKMREYAAHALGGIGKAAEPAIPALVDKLKDADEVAQTRIACAMALARIGPVNAAIKAVPTLLDVLGDPRHDGRVRERTMWALRVHQLKLRDMTGPKETFTRVLKEPVSANLDNKMLRYDCAYMLGMLWQQEAPDHTLVVLEEFLLDKEIKVYQSTTSAVEGSSAETKGGTASVKEQGKGDGRVMAVDALQAMGPGRYAKQARIMAQLKVLADDNTLYEPLRKKSAALIKAAQ
jgi:HEAT repeat protein